MADSPTDHPLRPKRTVRSFVRRAGRLTPGQEKALRVLWPRYGVELQPKHELNLEDLFGRAAPVILEIGFGNGDVLATLAGQHPQNNYIGIEVHRPGIGHLLQRLEQEGIDNVRVVEGDAKDVLAAHMPSRSLAGIHIFFPDPWHKKKHHKRRLVQPDFVQLLRKHLRLGGYLHIATDWEDYADHILSVMQEAEGFGNVEVDGAAERRPVTKFERRGRRLGHGVWDMVFERIE